MKLGLRLGLIIYETGFVDSEIVGEILKASVTLSQIKIFFNRS